ncbi:MAG TPA: matrixin family metalloprotease [Bdellovibrio sp.]|nr:matrixin family metalloprotease [Bdellovibrio sp.]
MRKWLGAGVLLLTALLIESCAPKSQTDCGFVQNSYGERVSWKDTAPITVSIHESVPDEFVGAIQSAADTWEKSAGHKLFIINTKKVTGPIAPHKDGSNIIYFMDTWDAAKPTEQARTSIYWTGDQIGEADIRVNALNFKFYWNGQKNSTEVNFEALILHELGHVLGLKHKDSGGSVMATYLPSGLDRIQLAATDVTDIKCEY